MIPLVLGLAGQFQQQPGWQVYYLTGTTVDKNTWTTLLVDGQPLEVTANSTWLFNAWVVGRSVDTVDDAGFQVAGVVTLDGGLIGTQQTTVARTNGSFNARATFDVLNDALAIQVRGLKDEEVNWAARVEVTPITE